MPKLSDPAIPTATTIAPTDMLYAVIGGMSSKISYDNAQIARTGNKNLTAYASLAAAIAAIGSTQSVVEIPANSTVSLSATVLSTMLLDWKGSAVISVSAGQTLSIHSSTEHWPRRKLFTGSGTVLLYNTKKSFPEWFGAVMDGTDDGTLDTPGIQKAIDSFPKTNKPHAGGEVPIRAAIINSTLTIEKNSIKLTGTGWGVSNEAPYAGFLKWNGSAGLPMALVKDCWLSGVESLRLIGKSTAKPSAAIEFNRSVAGPTLLNHACAERVFIGPMFGYDSDDAVQFDAGILFSGTIDGDTNLLQDIHINKATIGIDIQNPNNSVTQIDTLKVTECATGLKSNSFTVGTNWNFGGNDIDIHVTSGHRVAVKDFTTEGSTQHALVDTAGSLYIEDGGFEITNNIIASGYVIDADQGSHVELKNCRYGIGPGYTYSPLYKIRVKSPGGAAGYQWLKIDNVPGLGENQIDVTGPASTLQRTHVIFNRPPDSPNDAGANAVNLLTSNEAFNEKRFDFAGAVNDFGGPLKVRQIVAPTGLTLTAVGGTGTTRSYRVSAFTADGETLASTAVTVSGPATLDATHYINASWNPVVGAVGYKLYGRTGGSELLIATRYAYDIHTRPADGSVLSYKDDGSVTPSGALPTANTTGNVTVEGQSNLSRVVLSPISGVSWQDITGNSTSMGVRISGGAQISDGPSLQFFPDAAGFAGMYFDAGNVSGSDINFRKSTSGAMAVRIKQGTGSLEVDRTITAGGTTGNQTINKISGSVNIAAGGTTVTVTNSLVNSNSIVLCVLRTNDSTATIKNVVPGAGSFVVNLGAAATDEVSIGFLVLN